MTKSEAKEVLTISESALKLALENIQESISEALAEADRKWEARVIPNGKEMNWKGHKLRFELSPSDCVGCFFKDKNECPECDDGAWVEDSHWCTGTPIEEGWYLYEWGITGGNYATFRADTKEELEYLRNAKRWQKIDEK